MTTQARPVHYIAGSGSHGCLYDQCDLYDTAEDAVNAMAGLFNLGRTRRVKLAFNRYLELNPERDGADYIEIVACDCAAPQVHSDSRKA